jgi:hypothetical protein
MSTLQSYSYDNFVGFGEAALFISGTIVQDIATSICTMYECSATESGPGTYTFRLYGSRTRMAQITQSYGYDEYSIKCVLRTCLEYDEYRRIYSTSWSQELSKNLDAVRAIYGWSVPDQYEKSYSRLSNLYSISDVKNELLDMMHTCRILKAHL